MRLEIFDEARRFSVGLREVELSHVASLALESDEMVTFVSEGGREYDVTLKEWGYYATPSVGGRLRRFGMRAALMRNVDSGQSFVVLVFNDRLAAWQQYMESENEELVVWLDEL